MFTKVKLSGRRNQCPTCGLLFNSMTAFDKHRTGKFGVQSRRCLTTEEMAGVGMFAGEDGYWKASAREMGDAS